VVVVSSGGVSRRRCENTASTEGWWPTAQPPMGGDRFGIETTRIQRRTQDELDVTQHNSNDELQNSKRRNQGLHKAKPCGESPAALPRRGHTNPEWPTSLTTYGRLGRVRTATSEAPAKKRHKADREEPRKLQHDVWIASAMNKIRRTSVSIKIQLERSSGPLHRGQLKAVDRRSDTKRGT
jgi:hypothetical protein